MRRILILSWIIWSFKTPFMRKKFLSGISQGFPRVSQSLGQIEYVLLTRSPLDVLLHLVRLACIRHAASVRPEPGSNSQFENWAFKICSRLFACELTSLICLDQTMFDPHTAKLCSVFKVPTCVLVTQRFISYSLVWFLSTSFRYFLFRVSGKFLLRRDNKY